MASPADDQLRSAVTPALRDLDSRYAGLLAVESEASPLAGGGLAWACPVTECVVAEVGSLGAIGP
jgi:hypothetical protein